MGPTSTGRPAPGYPADDRCANANAGPGHQTTEQDRSGCLHGDGSQTILDFAASVRVARFRMTSLVMPSSSRTSMIDSLSVSAISGGT